MEIKKIVVWLLEYLHLFGFKTDPAISDVNGILLYYSYMDRILGTFVHVLFDRNLNIFPLPIKSNLDRSKRYNSDKM